MTPDQQQRCREAFEHWVSRSGDPDWKAYLERDSKGDYVLLVARGGWAAWQAQEARTQKLVEAALALADAVDEEDASPRLDGLVYKLRAVAGQHKSTQGEDDHG